MKLLQVLLVTLSMCFLCSTNTVQAVEQSKRFNIYEMSDILCDRGYYTLLPKRCILFVPQGFEDKMQREKGSKFLLFNKFIMTNHVWLYKLELTISEAEGKVAIDEMRMERLRKMGKVIVAVHKGKPISLEKMKDVNLTNLDK